MKSEYIELAHGNGGIRSRQLINEICLKYFGNTELNALYDGALIKRPDGAIVFTTDSYVVRPVVFPGGNIGILAVSGTVNDLSVMGAIPKYMSLGFILEEGFKICDLEIIAESIAGTARTAGVTIVTGDTKVVEKGSADGIFINTSGIGVIPSNQCFQGPCKIRPGDEIVISGTIGDHAAAIMTARNDFPLRAEVASDVAPLSGMIRHVLESAGEDDIRIMRDPTRGGVATTLNELVADTGCSCFIWESALPVSREVAGICELTGFDPLYLANEGKIIFVCSPHFSDKLVNLLKETDHGKNAVKIGHFSSDENEKVYLETVVGGTRICDMLVSDMLPRIC